MKVANRTLAARGLNLVVIKFITVLNLDLGGPGIARAVLCYGSDASSTIAFIPASLLM